MAGTPIVQLGKRPMNLGQMPDLQKPQKQLGLIQMLK
jgi:hypothetical protein